MVTKNIIRNCLVCGKELRITVYDDRTYEGGHFFGNLKLPVGNGENRIVGESDILGKGKKVKILEWTGECEEVEYWECDECYCE